MCGICGIVSIAGERPTETDRLRVAAMLQALSHRGPDDLSQHEAATAILGATRLAIRGGEDGRQPMVDAATGVVAVCNGEIDNHQDLRRWLAERGRPVTQATDVAVIPGLYLELGPNFAEKLTGAFAIALWDPRAGRLILARDRAGERPLFFTQTAGNVIFATAWWPAGNCRSRWITPLCSAICASVCLPRRPRPLWKLQRFRPEASFNWTRTAYGTRLTGAGIMLAIPKPTRRSTHLTVSFAKPSGGKLMWMGISRFS
jgi:asparagine synthetase B (glutamine-hydrolysing)